jgi:hypothetical protein
VPRNNRVFIAFAIEDEWARDYLVGQARNERSPFEFTDMSVREPFTDEWKRRCRARIERCDGIIALVSSNTARASGQLWEIRTAREMRLPLLAIYTRPDNRPARLPVELDGIVVRDWTWANITSFLNRL